MTDYKVRLDVFEGPLDLLLYLIKKDELNIYDIPMTRITGQYLEYLELMQALDLEGAGEFLVIAAVLTHLKSKMLLPPDPEALPEEPDPRAELVKRLLEYKAFKEAAGTLRVFEEKRSGLFTRWGVEPETDPGDLSFLEVSLFDLLSSFLKALKNLPKETVHQVSAEEFTVADKIGFIRKLLSRKESVRFGILFASVRSKPEAVVVFLALLELVRLREVTARQEEPFGEIEIGRSVRIAESRHE
ncbi:MAG: segregation/condensation protein A [Candidatus Omnitrophica bacterium]|nr:segregation/condensation protein A [Candidatus Omnitrophota bacterium]